MMNTYRISFTITTSLSRKSLEKFLDKLSAHAKVDRLAALTISDQTKGKRRGRPPVVQNAITEVLLSARGPVTQGRLAKKIDKPETSVYYALLKMISRDEVRWLEDGDEKVYYLTSRASEFEDDEIELDDEE